MRYTVVDKDNIYYLIEDNVSTSSVCIDISCYKIKYNKFVSYETNNTDILKQYLQKFLIDNKSNSLSDLFYYEYNIDKKYIDILGEEFCRRFIYNYDTSFIYKDTNVKHLIVDFDATNNDKDIVFKEPKCFPYHLSYLDIVITEDAKILYKNNIITKDTFYKIYQDYKDKLLLKIKSKDHLFEKIEQDLYKRYLNTMSHLKNSKNSDFNIESVVNVYEDEAYESYNPILKIYLNKHNRDDNTRYSLHLYGFDIRVSNILYFLIDKFGINIINKKLSFWSEISIDEQKKFRL